jgi:3-deoxy-7-phosphoheptulonate synthase
MLFIVGPCSIHDTEAGLEYAGRLKQLADQVSERILVVMRVYFEKPRTTVGWKGFINDPNLNGTYDVSTGLARAREFLIEVGKIGVAAATEWLDPFTPQYLGDLVSWGAIGARTTESQTHRLVASGLSMPIGFKNGTGGSVQIALDGIIAARSEHVFLGIDESGAASIVKTNGNPAVHLILRGGKTGPNYNAASVAGARRLLVESGLDPYLIVDCSHANSGKDYKMQSVVLRDLLGQRLRGDSGIVGVMLESHLDEGSQSLGDDPSALRRGVSITDACVGWEETDGLVREANSLLAG